MLGDYPSSRRKCVTKGSAYTNPSKTINNHSRDLIKYVTAWKKQLKKRDEMVRARGQPAHLLRVSSPNKHELPTQLSKAMKRSKLPSTESTTSSTGSRADNERNVRQSWMLAQLSAIHKG